MRQKWNNHKCYWRLNFTNAATDSALAPHDKAGRRAVEWKIDGSLAQRIAFPTQLFSHHTRNKMKKIFQFAQRTFFRLHFKSKTLLILFFLSRFTQPATATDTPDAVVSIWSCTSYRVVFRVEFVWIVDTTQPDGIAITAKRDSTEIQQNQSPTKRHADVSSRSWFLALFCRSACSRTFNDFSTISISIASFYQFCMSC